MAAMKLRLEPSDEYMHPLESATNFNESMYFNFYDPSERMGGWVRLGNRANEGYAEMTKPKSSPKLAVSHRYHHGDCQ